MQLIPPKAILLDMDDTIISFDHGVDTDACWRNSIRYHMPEVEAAYAEELLMLIKEQASWYWSDPERHRTGRLDLAKVRQEIISASLQKLGLHDLYLAGNIATTYGLERDKLVALFPESIETIKKLRAKGIKLALLTNGNANTQWRKIHLFELEAHFDCILVEGDLGMGKPEERFYLHALQQLGVAAGETWMVGDNFEWEVAAPQRLGIKGIWIDHKKRGLPAKSSTQPFKIIGSLSELLYFLS
ncbi:putative hydrolase of the HAD superfamily [Paenibacillaceae bacterium GAS479]|nr:putative hydrolase of the HAD superfamily [Paenibacillaceae bacterium GAS479]